MKSRCRKPVSTTTHPGIKASSTAHITSSGSRFELGVVFTMIAGLLNILAIYDALEGPAYDGEEESPAESEGSPSPAPA